MNNAEMYRHRRVDLGPFIWEKHRLDNDRRSHHSATLVGGRLYIFGGYTSGDYRLHNDVLTVTATETGYREEKLAADSIGSHSFPESRYGHSANLVEDRLLVVGGSKLDGVCLNLVHAFDLVLHVWSTVATRGHQHTTLFKHVAEYVQGLDVVLFFGGKSGGQLSNDVNLLQVRSMCWKPLTPSGTAPSPRAMAASCMLGSTCFVFGGRGYRGTYRDIHLLKIPPNGDKASWSSPVVHRQPSQRIGGALAYLQGGLFLFGGQDALDRRQFNDLYVFDLHMQLWSRTVPRNVRLSKAVVEVRGSPPARRVGHSMTAMPNGSLLVYGGTSAIGGIGGIDTLQPVT